jgi:hypothetical protein
VRGVARRGRRAGAGAVIAAVLLGGVTGCGGIDLQGLRGSVSACYRAIPVAHDAVRDPRAQLLGVHRVPADQVAGHLPPDQRSTVEKDTTVCAVAFKGPFAAGQVMQAPPADQGEYAIVLVTSRKLELVHSYVLATLPKRFRGRLT